MRMKLFRRIKELREEKRFIVEALKHRRRAGFMRGGILDFPVNESDNSLKSYFSKIKGLK
ncbi:MAG: hypothetical protein IJC07_01485 [Clostridia bacterium]|nr:hypothetical protein [Clostridia bacterium]